MTHRDETPMQSADRCAAAISAYITAVAHRMAFGPHHVVPDEERAAYDAVRDELHQLATHEYDRGYLTAIARRSELAR